MYSYLANLHLKMMKWKIHWRTTAAQTNEKHFLILFTLEQ